jgi:Integrase core domain
MAWDSGGSHGCPITPWQNAYVERLIGSIRRECLDHAIVLNETGLRRILKSYFEYYEREPTYRSARTRRSADRSSPLGWDRSSRSRRSAACTIATNEPPLRKHLSLTFLA